MKTRIQPCMFMLFMALCPFALTAQTNVAMGKTAKQSSTKYDQNGAASNAVDGKTTGAWAGANNTITHTNDQDDPWWEVDLGGVYDISKIEIWNRTDECCWNRLQNFYVMVSESPISANSTSQNQYDAGPHAFTTSGHPSMILNSNKNGRYVRIFISGKNKVLSLAEVQVYAKPAAATSPAIVFEHTNYGGKSMDLVEGMNTGPLKIGNDAVSSLKVQKGWRVILYENAPGTGKELVLTADTPDLVKLNFNDITSNIKVEKIPNGIYSEGDMHPCGGTVISVDASGKNGVIAATKDLNEENITKTIEAAKALGKGWGLPNQQTVELMYKDYQGSNKLGLQNGWYWTSNQVSNGYWAAQNFSDGIIANRFSGERQYCRPVLSFNPSTTCESKATR